MFCNILVLTQFMSNFSSFLHYENFKNLLLSQFLTNGGRAKICGFRFYIQFYIEIGKKINTCLCATPPQNGFEVVEPKNPNFGIFRFFIFFITEIFFLIM